MRTRDRLLENIKRVREAIAKNEKELKRSELTQVDRATIKKHTSECLELLAKLLAQLAAESGRRH